ncbi:MAG TPA: DUF2304 domain-containing protein [Rheinheimera sp.]|uniref:DUF2304 domain-containing protein n=1 Tax=Rheinheimera sp. TaxID=1869214 RepID=UPI002F92343A
MTVRLISAFLGLLAFIFIIRMIRRDRLVSKDASSWIAIACFVVVLGVFPELTDGIGHLLNIGYPPVLPLIVAVLFLLLKMVRADMDKIQQKADIERLLQHQALLYAELEKLKKKICEP